MGPFEAALRLGAREQRVPATIHPTETNSKPNGIRNADDLSWLGFREFERDLGVVVGQMLEYLDEK